jgi:hypothetical protein
MSRGTKETRKTGPEAAERLRALFAERGREAREWMADLVSAGVVVVLPEKRRACGPKRASKACRPPRRRGWTWT